MTAYRYLYRITGQSNDDGPWECYFTAYNTQTGANRLVTEWTRLDQGRRMWRCEECSPGDIDYPRG